jgi:hypothetical protein
MTSREHSNASDPDMQKQPGSKHSGATRSLDIDTTSREHPNASDPDMQKQPGSKRSSATRSIDIDEVALLESYT